MGTNQTVKYTARESGPVPSPFSPTILHSYLSPAQLFMERQLYILTFHRHWNSWNKNGHIYTDFKSNIVDGLIHKEAEHFVKHEIFFIYIFCFVNLFF